MVSLVWLYSLANRGLSLKPRRHVIYNSPSFVDRFLRELRDLKMSADYTSCDPTKLGDWLVAVGPEFSQYIYQMLHAGVDRQTLRSLNHDHLFSDCAIDNGIHRMKILGKIEGKETGWLCGLFRLSLRGM